jgi:hypothetical protein
MNWYSVFAAWEDEMYANGHYIADVTAGVYNQMSFKWDSYQ